MIKERKRLDFFLYCMLAFDSCKKYFQMNFLGLRWGEMDIGEKGQIFYYLG